MQKPREPREIQRLDLARYGLAYLEGSNVLALPDADSDKLLKALGNDDISVKVPISCTPPNVQRILSYSECRRCGKCCVPNPLNPGNPGVEVLENELKSIASHLSLPYETLEARTVRGKAILHPGSTESPSFTRFLPLPCPYYDAEAGACRIYPVRPIVCAIHPVVFGEDISQISIRAGCDYGKDLIKAAFNELRKSNPELVIKL